LPNSDLVNILKVLTKWHQNENKRSRAGIFHGWLPLNPSRAVELAKYGSDRSEPSARDTAIATLGVQEIGAIRRASYALEAAILEKLFLNGFWDLFLYFRANLGGL
jgi:hypothetical protein